MAPTQVRFWQGNEALFEGALAAGATFFAGYPITPSSEIAELAARRLPAVGGVYLQMEDELGSMAAIIGASLAGRLAFTATSGPGFSLMQENLGLAIMTETPCLVINVQRSGPSTGLATRPAQGDLLQARWGTHGDHGIIALVPGSVQDCYDLAYRGGCLAEKYRTPVVILADEIIGHLRERVTVPTTPLEPAQRRRPQCAPEDYRPYAPDADGVPPLATFGGDYVFHANGSMHDERGWPDNTADNAARVIRRLHDKVFANSCDFATTRSWETDDAQVLLVSCGAAARAARQTVLDARSVGRRLGLLELTTLWPFPVEAVEAAGLRADAVVVCEMNLGQLVLEVERVIGRRRPVIGACRSDGTPLTPPDILSRVEEVA